MPQKKIHNWFDDIEPESVEKATEFPPTFPLPKVGDGKMSYVIRGNPYLIDTPNSRFNKTAIKMPVSINGIDGEIFVPKSLATNIAIALKRIGYEFDSPKLDMEGMEITIWMESDTNTGFQYYHCIIEE